MEQQVDFYPLLVVTLLAVAVPVILHRIPRIAIPIVVGEILAGILVGPSGLDLLGQPDPWLSFLKVFGFSYLMFLCGLEIDFNLLFRTKRAAAGPDIRWKWLNRPAAAGAVSFALTLAVAGIASLWMQQYGLVGNAVLMALVLSTTSLGVVMPVLKERGLSGSSLGQSILAIAVLGDFATVFLLSVYVVLQTEGLSFDILLILILLAVTFLVYRLMQLSQRHLPMERWIEELSHATGQLDTRGALALAVVFIALAQGLGVEIILGAFIAGVIVSLLSDRESSLVRPKLNALGYGFFIPIFFIMVGVDFDLRALLDEPSGPTLVFFLILLAFVVKFAGALVFKFFLSWREVFALGTLTSARLSLIIAVAEIGVEIGAISTAMNSAIILVSIVTVLLCPVAFNRLAEPVQPAQDKVMIVGDSPRARLLAERMLAHGEKVVKVMQAPTVKGTAPLPGLEIVGVSSYSEEELKRIWPANVSAMVCMVEDERLCLRLATAAQDDFGVENVVAYAGAVKDARPFVRKGIQLVDPILSSVAMLEALVRNPDMLSLLTEQEPNRLIRDIRVKRPTFDGRRLGQIRVPGGALIISIGRQGEITIPHGDTRLRRGDRLTVAGSMEAIEKAAEYFG